jgi:3-dehydrotetronate 4-kinase
MKLGCIADDFTGATDLANNLVRAGMRVIQMIGVPDNATALPENVDAVVIALKSRTIAPALAIEQSLAALTWLKARSADQIYFKYCSTFDSTAQGNIGPVIQALMKALNTNFTVATPAFPDNGRTVFKGHLFVGDVLLNESGMQHHPLTPMTDANLVRVLQAQCDCKVGLINYRTVAQGAAQIATAIEQLKQPAQPPQPAQPAIQIAIVDALSNEDLMRIGSALKAMPLVTGGSGVAIGLPANWGIAPTSTASQLPKASGFQAIVSGSCSLATQAQVGYFKAQSLPTIQVMVSDLTSPQSLVDQVLAEARYKLTNGPVLIYSTADAQTVQANQLSAVKGQDIGSSIEKVLAQITCGLVNIGVKQLIVAGGETSGACVQALGLAQMQIGPQIDPGVPWCYAPLSNGDLHIALKSGNFGSEDFFVKAFQQL